MFWDETDHVLRDVSFTIIGDGEGGGGKRAGRPGVGGGGVNICDLHFYDYSSLSKFLFSKGDRRQKNLRAFAHHIKNFNVKTLTFLLTPTPPPTPMPGVVQLLFLDFVQTSWKW